ncbi:MAG: hypothetical protein AAGI52_13905 [Bacteroidota bacterium]
MRLVLVLATLLPSASLAQPSEAALANHYDLSVTLDPATGDIEVAGTLRVVADERLPSLAFLLNRGVTIRSLGGTGIAGWSATDSVQIGGTPLSSTQQIEVQFDPVLERGDSVHVAFDYGGRIDNTTIEIGRGIVSPAWTELSVGSLWYPFSLQETLVTSRLRVTVPESSDVVGTGQIETVAPGVWQIEATRPLPARITLALSDRWHTASRTFADGQRVEVRAAVPSPRVDLAMDTARRAYAAFEATFGPLQEESQTLRLLYPNDVPDLIYPGEAYAAGNLVAMADSDNETAWLGTIHHEVSHMWWNRGAPGTPDEFLSESLAEYSALLLGSQTFGTEWQAQRLASLRSRSDQIDASLLELNGFPPERQGLLYARGPVALWWLREHIGAEALDALLQEVHSQQTDSLQAFLDLLAEREGKALSGAFRSRL